MLALCWALPAAWAEEGPAEPILTPEEELPEQPHAGHQLTLRLGAVTAVEAVDENVHRTERAYDLFCVDCGEVVAHTDQREILAENHVFPEDGWKAQDGTGIEYNRCAVCGYEIQREAAPCAHQWSVESMQPPTCTEKGYLIRVCTVCGERETLESPEQGHAYEWVSGDGGIREYKCLVCGDVKETAEEANEKMYNNTITSLGPTTRELIGGSVWNRVTPLDVSQEGVFTYPLIASNRYSVGLATVTLEDGVQTVSYVLNSRRIEVHSQSLIIYPNLESLRTGQDAVAFEFDQPIDLKEFFGDDRFLIMSITLKADYVLGDPDIQGFISDDGQITLMNELID